MSNSRLFQWFSPDFESALTELPLGQLRLLGVKVLAFDVDHTLGVGRTREVSEQYLEYLRLVRRAGFRLLLASNALADLSPLGELIGAEVVPATFWSRKPMRSYFRRLVETAECDASELAMVGDKTLTDVFGANRCGLVSVKVTALGRRYWGGLPKKRVRRHS